MTQGKIALVLGATGGIGGEVARRLRGGGWRVRALNRRALSKAADDFEWIQGDAMNAADVVAAARGATIIIHAVNPPGYRNWRELVLPMLESSIAAAKASGARIILPGTVYNFGPDAWPTLREESPQNPRTRKGAIRVEMERRLRAAADQGVRSLIVRAGDFFGPRAVANSWFAQGLIKAGKPIASISYPGRKGIGHQWAYLPDVAETIVRLIEKDDRLGAFEMFHMEGHWDPDGTQMVAAIAQAAGKPDLKARAFPWPIVTLASPFVTLFREMREMRYLWREPLRMDNTRLVGVLGAEPHTPLDEAVTATLVGIGCLPPARQALSAAARTARSPVTAASKA